MSFLDDDPEDGFDASDPLHERLRNIGLRLMFVLSAINSPELERRLRSVAEDLERIRLELQDG